MAESFYLLLPRADGIARWLTLDALGNRIGAVRHGSLMEAATEAQGRRVTALVPGEHVSLLKADIPSKSAQKVLQAAPYMLEDRLADDVESLHFAAGGQDAGGHLISATARGRMRHWLELMAQVGLQPAQLVPDLCALAPQADAAVVAVDQDRVLVRLPDGGGFTAESELALHLLKRRLADTNVPLQRVVLHAPEGGEASFDPLAGDGVVVEHQRLADSVLPLLVAGLRAQRPLNLLQGEFQIRSSFQEHWRVWRTAVVLAGVCLVFAAVQQTMVYVNLKRQAAALDAEVVQVFNQAMPGSQQVIGREDEEMKSTLARLQGSSATGSLLPLLDALGGGLASNPSIQVLGLNFQGGSLQAQLQAADVGSLDALKTTLAKQNGLAVSLDSVNASGSQVTGRIVLGGNPS